MYPFLSLELSIQPSLNAILIPPHLRSPAGSSPLSQSSQGKPGWVAEEEAWLPTAVLEPGLCENMLDCWE